MAEAIKKELSVEATLIAGSGGVFDVKADGARVWSKQQSGRFPEHHEVMGKLRGPRRR